MLEAALGGGVSECALREFVRRFLRSQRGISKEIMTYAAVRAEDEHIFYVHTDRFAGAFLRIVYTIHVQMHMHVHVRVHVHF